MLGHCLSIALLGALAHGGQSSPRTRQAPPATQGEGETRYQALFNSLIDMVIVYAREPDGGPGVMLEVNDAACRMSGYTREELLGKLMHEFVLPTPVPVGLAERERLINRGRVLLERQLITKSGQIIPLEVNGNMISYHGQAATLVICRDISEKKLAEQTRINAQKLESLGLLAGGIAHDFNNLLAGLQGHIDLARHALSAGDAKAASNWLGDSLAVFERAKGLTHQLLTFSKGGQPRKQLTAMEPLLRETVRFAMSGSPLQATFSLPERLWACHLDPNQLGQAVNNLLINSQQAMPQGGTITIQADNLPYGTELPPGLPAGNWLKITVIDQGVGIPKEHLPNLFTPYFTTKQKGSGLGLATSYAIVKNHGGEILVESEPGRGARFSLFLPAEPEAVVTQRGGDVPALRGQGRILLMDDEPFIRTTTQTLLQMMGYDAQSTPDGEAAVTEFKRSREAGQSYDLVILDLTISGGPGGVDTLSRLREIDPAIKAIASSGYSEDAVMADPDRFGFLAALSKPYNHDQLVQALRTALGRSVPAKD